MFPHYHRILAATLLLAAPLILSLPNGLVAQTDAPKPSLEEATLKKIYDEALAHGQAFDNLRTLVTQTPGRLSGSQSLERAIDWATQTLTALKPDRVYQQDVMVPHWERGAKETVAIVPPAGVKGEAVGLSAVALGGSTAGDVTAEIVEVQSLAEVEKLGREKLAGKIVFYNRPMDPTMLVPGFAYFSAGDQRNLGPAAAAKQGAAAVLVRSLTHAHNDVPHTGASSRDGHPGLPAAALSTLAADRLSAALAVDPHTRVHVVIHAQWFDDAPSHNVIGEIRGTEFPNEIILVGGHLDSWDIAPGANDDGSGVVQSIEVLRLFRALGLRPRHTLRAVLFTNEENGVRGATAYAGAAKDAHEKHIFAVESDAGSFQPHGFSIGSTQGDAHLRAARWLPLFQPYRIFEFRKGNAGTDVTPLLVQGTTVAEIVSDTQRYFDYHHTTEDKLDNVNPRELALGAAALTSLIWLVDTQGL